MSLYRRRQSPSWYVSLRWKGYPRLQVSTGTPSKARARAMERTLYVLKGNGRRDLIELLAAGSVRLEDVHEHYLNDPAALEQRVHQVASPVLGALVDAWVEWLENPGVLSPKTRRPYAPGTIARYGDSWARFFVVLPRGRESTMADSPRAPCWPSGRPASRTGSPERRSTATSWPSLPS